MKSLNFETIHSMPASAGVTVPSVSWPTMMKPFSGAQHVHDLGAVGGDVELGPRLGDGLPDGESVERVDVDLECELTGERDPADPCGMPPTRVVSRKPMNSKASSGDVEVRGRVWR